MDVSQSAASAVKGDTARAVFVQPWDIQKISLLTKSSVASEQFGLQTIMTPRMEVYMLNV